MACRQASSRGFTLVEVLGALAIVALVSVGAAAMIHGALEDMRGHHAGQHQAKAVEASERYVREHYTDLVTLTTAAPVAVPMTSLAGLLPEGFQATNAFGQTPCLRVMQPAPGRLNALIVAEGGVSIPTRDLAYVAAQAGPGGGQITAEDPAVAQGAFGSWRVDTAAYGATPCGPGSGSPATNRLASALFFDGPQTGTDFLYRGEVPGHPELNSLSVPLGMTGRAVALEDDSTDPLCSAADPLSQGRIAVSASGVLLSCQAGTWRRQGSAFWKDPVASFAALPATGNREGDTRLTLDTQRAYAWNGSEWRALAVDAQGDMEVPRQITLPNAVALDSPCAPVGAISREASGRTLSCQAGRWRTQASTEIDESQSENGAVVVMRSNYATYPGGTQFYSGGFTYDAPNDTVMASVERPLVPTKDGLIISNATLDMSIGTYDDRDDVVTVTLITQVIDRDTGAVLAVNQSRQTRMSFDRAILAVTLSKAVPRNVNGYTYQMLVRWTKYVNNYAQNFYDRANYIDTFGNTVELTPIHLSWNIDMTY
jgi:prepilin-type N-terminal cleavage/methylation domain-containing protein